VVSLQAALGGASDIALGNVVGSNIGNVGLILGATALLAPVRAQAQVLRLEVPIMIGVSVLLMGLWWDGVIGRFNGIVLVIGAAAYAVLCVWGARDESRPAVRAEFEDGVPSTRGWAWDLGFGVGGLGLLVVGARWLVDGAVSIGEALGISTVVIGLTVVAVGTSLPELATSLVAARRGQSDIALGNVLGSNIFNVLGILGITATVQPIDTTGLPWYDGAVLLAFAVLTVPLLWGDATFSRREGGLLLAAYAVYLTARILVGV
jgi:cation:H+ antiporter